MGERDEGQRRQNPRDNDHGPGHKVESTIKTHRREAGDLRYFTAHLRNSDRVSKRLTDYSKLPCSFGTKSKSHQARKRDLELVVAQCQLPSPSLGKVRDSCHGDDRREPPTQCYNVLPELARTNSPDQVSKQSSTDRDSEKSKRESRFLWDSKHRQTSPRTD